MRSAEALSQNSQHETQLPLPQPHLTLVTENPAPSTPQPIETFGVMLDSPSAESGIFVERSESNDHLFTLNSERNRYEMIAQNLGVIADLLSGSREMARTQSSSLGTLLIFDKHGNFYQNARFEEFDGENPKKVANFTILDEMGDREPINVPLHDIHFATYPKMGDQQMPLTHTHEMGC